MLRMNTSQIMWKFDLYAKKTINSLFKIAEHMYIYFFYKLAFEMAKLKSVFWQHFFLSCKWSHFRNPHHAAIRLTRFSLTTTGVNLNDLVHCNCTCVGQKIVASNACFERHLRKLDVSSRYACTEWFNCKRKLHRLHS